MKQVLKRLLDDLDKISEQHEEVSDTDVREQMYVAIGKGFIMPEAGYMVPKVRNVQRARQLESVGGDRQIPDRSRVGHRVEGVPDTTGPIGLVSRRRRAFKHWHGL